MTPLTSVDKPLPPTVSRLEPRKKVPAPAIEPAVIPVVVKPDMSITPPVLMVNCAWPPVLWSVKITESLVLRAFDRGAGSREDCGVFGGGEVVNTEL